MQVREISVGVNVSTAVVSDNPVQVIIDIQASGGEPDPMTTGAEASGNEIVPVTTSVAASDEHDPVTAGVAASDEPVPVTTNAEASDDKPDPVTTHSNSSWGGGSLACAARSTSSRTDVPYYATGYVICLRLPAFTETGHIKCLASKYARYTQFHHPLRMLFISVEFSVSPCSNYIICLWHMWEQTCHLICMRVQITLYIVFV